MSIHGHPLARKAAQAELRWCIGWSFGFYWLPADAEESHVPGTWKHVLGDRGRQEGSCCCVIWGLYENRTRFSESSLHFLDSAPHWRRNQEPGLHSNRASVQEVGRWQGLPKCRCLGSTQCFGGASLLACAPVNSAQTKDHSHKIFGTILAGNNAMSKWHPLQKERNWSWQFQTLLGGSFTNRFYRSDFLQSGSQLGSVRIVMLLI